VNTKIDVATEVARINKHILDHGFHKPGAEPDFQYGEDTRLRFKTGTVYGEVTVTVWQGQRQVDVIRCTNEAQVTEALHEIDRYVHAFFMPQSPGRTPREPYVRSKADC
jgi:hypothetical protein